MRRLLPSHPLFDPVARERVVSFSRFLWKRFVDDKCFEAAGALSYTTVFALVPLAVAVLGIMSAFPQFGKWSQQITDFIFANFVPSTGRAVQGYLTDAASKAAQLTSAGVIGLIIGGPLVDAFGWRAIFLIQVPLLAIALAMAWRVLPETDRAEQTTFDVLGNVMLGVALLALLIGVERGRSWGWGSAPTIGCFVLAAVASVLFIRVELRVDHPLLPVQYFRTRSFTMPIVVIFFAQFGYMGGFILAPKLLDEIGHESATHISTLLIPRPLTFAIAGAAAGWFMRRLGMRNIAAIGSMLVVVSLMMIAAVTDELNTWVVVGAIALSGLGMGMVQPAIAASVANSVDDRDLGVAGAAQQMSVQVATSLGMNLLDTVQAGLVATSGLAASYASSYHLGALLTLGGVVAAWFVPKGTA